jgi:hypothetical protein
VPEEKMPAFALTPIAWWALRLGAVAAVAAFASRQASEPKHAGHEKVLDDLPEGINAHAHRAEAERGMHASGRFRRVLRFGPQGPALEIEAAGLGRVRLRRAG